MTDVFCEDWGEAGEEEITLCGSNSYIKKFYFNEEFLGIPESIRQELKVMCVWFTEECGGIFLLQFDEEGNLKLKHIISEYDGYCDEIGAGLKIRQIQEEKAELLRSLELYYKIFILGMGFEEAGIDRKGNGK